MPKPGPKRHPAIPDSVHDAAQKVARKPAQLSTEDELTRSWWNGVRSKRKKAEKD